MKRVNKVGRPPRPMPEPIPDTPENVARALLTSPPKSHDEWEYLKDAKESTAKNRQGTAKCE